MEAAKTQTQFQSKIAAEFWLHLAGRDYRLVGKSIRLGRAPDNEIVLEDKSISRYHALISITPEHIILEDLKSRNGTRVNSSPIKRAELLDRDEITIGDLKGHFYQKIRNANSVKFKSPTELGKISIEALGLSARISQVKEKFKNLSKAKRMLVVTGALFAFAILVLLLSASAPAPMMEESQAMNEPQIVQTPVEKKSFERCLDLEDLASFRQSIACYQQLPFTVEVKEAIERVRSIQSRLSKERFTEGEQAFKNYYYDVAIQKWQEVLLIADDESKFFAEAYRGIQEAEQRKKLQ